jgi:hypothetical protein
MPVSKQRKQAIEKKKQVKKTKELVKNQRIELGKKKIATLKAQIEQLAAHHRNTTPAGQADSIYSNIFNNEEE